MLKQLPVHILLLLMLLAACASQPAPSAGPTDQAGADKITGATGTTPTSNLAAMATSVAPTALLLQLDFEPTFYRPEAFHPFGRVPAFTLSADGRAIYLEGQNEGDERAMEARLSPQERDALLRQVWDMGFAQLESYTDDCQPIDEELSVCTQDASFTILRARQPNGVLREVKIYYDYGPAPDVLRAVRSFLSDYEHPAAEPYRPERATLFVRPTTPTGVEVQPWPLNPALLDAPTRDVEQWARVLEGDDLARYLTIRPRNLGDFYVVHEGQGYAVTLVPWLPGVDYSEEVAEYGLRRAPTLEDLR